MGLFNTLKTIVTAPVKLAGKVSKTPVGKAVGHVLKPVYESVVPSPVRDVLKKVGKVMPLAKLLKPKGASNVGDNVFEKVLREMADVIKAIQDKAGTTELVAEVVGLFVAVGPAYEEIGKLSAAEKREQLKLALDNVIGEEPDALFGPNGSLVKFDIPFFSDETATDLAISGIVNLAIKDAPAATGD